MADEEKKVEETPAAESAPAAEETKEAPKAEAKAEKKDLPYKAKLSGIEDLRTGMTVKVHERIKDISPKGEERERIQIFEGIILGIRGAGLSRTMTVRKEADGYGVEKIYPINSPVVDKVELVKTAKTRRAKMNFLSDTKNRFRRKLKEKWVK